MVPYNPSQEQITIGRRFALTSWKSSGKNQTCSKMSSYVLNGSNRYMVEIRCQRELKHDTETSMSTLFNTILAHFAITIASSEAI